MLPNILKQTNILLPEEFDSVYDKVLATYRKEKKEQQNYLQDLLHVIQMGTPAFHTQKTNFLSPVIKATWRRKHWMSFIIPKAVTSPLAG
ncbi:hypothetical protein GCM10010965_21530 [Caldalkalibacillus thermarum]|uniref:hypothetical protein n=1 Tax=Caldalkalibacillus thermarum TaxID=296745 RepID=UPI00166CC8C2|nr:hypothetical protein [Caldalkalibacillus thermarum]GGK28356.1 hypothetical protein GCM10010965_21530 [Caldalkalibacillus thermarum]